MLKLSKYSIGVGDRFAHQAAAQLNACVLAHRAGVEISPVWNKSNREHNIIGSEPISVRRAADLAVSKLGWKLPYFCDADHIGLQTVDRFLDACDFFTIDVADFIGKPADSDAIDSFVKRHSELNGNLKLELSQDEVLISRDFVHATATKFLLAVQEAGNVYRKIRDARGESNSAIEISMDETDAPQTPAELIVILAAIADEKIPIQTIAPKFSGRFNKGVDYVGNVEHFDKELTLDVAAVDFAVRAYGLPANLKLSIHSGSDKFSIYPSIYTVMKRFNTGVHLKTAGTTWLEELIGLAESGGRALELAKEIYVDAYAHAAELCTPYQSVIDIDEARLPSPGAVNSWTSEQFTDALRHDQKCQGFNPHFRQLMHVGFKVAAKMGTRYTYFLEENEAIISKNVTENLYARHIAPVFLGKS